MSDLRKIRYGMVGGGPGAFIGSVHRKAAGLDGVWQLVAGAFSSDGTKSREQGARLGLDSSRVYESWLHMLESESALPVEERMEAVVIVTPNDLHYAVAAESISRGFHVVCDKPLTNTPQEAESLCRLAREHGVVFAVTYVYSGYPMVKEARERVARGELGTLRKIVVEYPQGWLAERVEQGGNKQAAWRTDPTRAGVSACVADIGSHAEHLARYITGLHIESLCAELTTFVPGRALDDDANMLVRWEGGVRGVLYASQVSTGEENNLRIRVYGTKGSLDWQHRRQDELTIRSLDGSVKMLARGGPHLSDRTQHFIRLPGGHPEGFIEAFANIYRSVGRTLAARAAGRTPHPFDEDYPTVEDGAVGVQFIHKAVESARQGATWIDMGPRPGGTAGGTAG